MYGSVQQSGRRTRAIGLVTATALTVGFGYVLAEGMNLDIMPKENTAMEMVIITPPVVPLLATTAELCPFLGAPAP